MNKAPIKVNSKKYIILALGTTILCLFIILTFDELTANGILLDLHDLVFKTALVATFIFAFLKLYPYLHPYLIIEDKKDNDETTSD